MKKKAFAKNNEGNSMGTAWGRPGTAWGRPCFYAYQFLYRISICLQNKLLTIIADSILQSS